MAARRGAICCWEMRCTWASASAGSAVRGAARKAVGGWGVEGVRVGRRGGRVGVARGGDEVRNEEHAAIVHKLRGRLWRAAPAEGHQFPKKNHPHTT